MAAQPVKSFTVEVLTTDTTSTVLWADTDSEDRSYEIYITAASTELGSFVDYRIWAIRFIRYTNFEATVLSTSTDLHAATGTAGLSGATATVQIDGSGDTEIRVVGVGTLDITWRAEIRYMKIRP
jgi:hypothetical protein